MYLEAGEQRQRERVCQQHCQTQRRLEEHRDRREQPEQRREEQPQRHRRGVEQRQEVGGGHCGCGRRRRGGDGAETGRGRLFRSWAGEAGQQQQQQ